MHRVWNDYAILRQTQLESGVDTTFSNVFVPYYVKVANWLKPETILEIGSGTGHLAKELSRISPNVVTLEPCIDMVNIAKAVCKGTKVIIENCKIEEYKSQKQFQLIISHLCIQSVHDVDLFLKSTKGYLSQKGMFLFCVPHPCFWNDLKAFIPLEDYRYFNMNFKEVDFSLEKDPNNIFRKIPFIHRPLKAYFNYIRNVQLCVRDFDEIYTENVDELKNRNCTPRYAVFYVSKYTIDN